MVFKVYSFFFLGRIKMLTFCTNREYQEHTECTLSLASHSTFPCFFLVYLHVPIGSKPLMLMFFIWKTAFITELWLHGLLCGKWDSNYIMLELTASARYKYLSPQWHRKTWKVVRSNADSSFHAVLNLHVNCTWYSFSITETAPNSHSV